MLIKDMFLSSVSRGFLEFATPSSHHCFVLHNYKHQAQVAQTVEQGGKFFSS